MARERRRIHVAPALPEERRRAARDVIDTRRVSFPGSGAARRLARRLLRRHAVRDDVNDCRTPTSVLPQKLPCWVICFNPDPSGE